MFSSLGKRTIWLTVFFFTAASLLCARADSWQSWGNVYTGNTQFGGAGAQLATDGTNMYYSTYLSGIYRGAFADRNFSALPLTGFPLWDANTNTNGYALTQVAVTPQGTVVISGSPVFVVSNSIAFNSSNTPPNPLPVFYWWDETNQLWHAATVTGKSYPYTGNVCNFSIAPDGSLWTGSGFAAYAYRSTNGGQSYTAFSIDALVPTNYFPLPFTGGQTNFGEIFSVCAGWNGEVVIGTESGGYLHTTNNGVSWRSLDPNFTNTNSVNPFGRIGDARVAGLDHYGNFLCANFQMAVCPARTNWSGVTLIGYRPKDGTYFNAANGFTNGFGPARVLTPPSGVTFCFMNQNYLLQGGIWRAFNGKNWTQFNQGSGLDVPFATGITNALGPGNCITTLGNQIFIGVGNGIYVFDSTPPPVTNRPPVALPQNVNLLENTPTNFTLTGSDADGDALNFTVTMPPTFGTLGGTPPNLTYTPLTNSTGVDRMLFMVDDGMATSAPVVVNFATNLPTNQPPTISFTCSANRGWLVSPTNLVLSANVSAVNGIQQVNFYSGTNGLTFVTKSPYVFTWTNPPPGDYVLNARVVDKFEASTWAQPLTISILSTAPKLLIQQADPNNVAVTWPLALDGFFVESAPNASGPWTLSLYPQIYFTNGQTATIPMADHQFFRLMHPH